MECGESLFHVVGVAASSQDTPGRREVLPSLDGPSSSDGLFNSW